MTRGLPILFSGEMVRAILEGRKSQTRRVKKSDKPKYQVGDTLWVQETFAFTEPNYADQPGVVYRATDPDSTVCKQLFKWQQYIVRHWDETFIVSHCDETEGSNWRPSIFMPRWASRITLEVTGVRCEKLHDITDADAKKEGVKDANEYMELWNKINGNKRPWDSNPEVWVYEFKVKEK